MNQNRISAVTKTTLLILAVAILSILGALASIGISYLTHDFNYFLFTVGGESLLLVFFSLILIIRKVRKHGASKRL